MSSVNIGSIDQFMFATQTLEHPKFKEAIDRIMRAILSPSDTTVIHVLGASGVGKSSLRRAMIKRLNAHYHNIMIVNRTMLPVAGIELRALGTKHSWKAFYEEALAASKHVDPTSETLGIAREKLATTWQKREMVAFWVDEAHHVLQGLTQSKPIEEQSEVIKSITQDCPTKLVLFGTNKLLPLIRTNGQTARRSEVIPLHPYGPGDRDEFRQILAYLDANCAGSLAVSLEDLHEDLYRGSFGFIGILRNWLVKALAFSTCPGRITTSALEETIPDPLSLKPNLLEAREIEEQLEMTPEEAALIDTLLSGVTPPKAETKPNATDTRRRPGAPRARRHRIGIEALTTPPDDQP